MREWSGCAQQAQTVLRYLGFTVADHLAADVNRQRAENSFENGPHDRRSGNTLRHHAHASKDQTGSKQDERPLQIGGRADENTGDEIACYEIERERSAALKARSSPVIGHHRGDHPCTRAQHQEIGNAKPEASPCNCVEDYRQQRERDDTVWEEHES